MRKYSGKRDVSRVRTAGSRSGRGQRTAADAPTRRPSARAAALAKAAAVDAGRALVESAPLKIDLANPDPEALSSLVEDLNRDPKRKTRWQIQSRQQRPTRLRMPEGRGRGAALERYRSADRRLAHRPHAAEGWSETGVWSDQPPAPIRENPVIHPNFHC